MITFKPSECVSQAGVTNFKGEQSTKLYCTVHTIEHPRVSQGCCLITMHILYILTQDVDITVYAQLSHVQVLSMQPSWHHTKQKRKAAVIRRVLYANCDMNEESRHRRETVRAM